MKYYINYFKDFGLSIYFFKTGFDLVLICVTISIYYKTNENESANI